MDVEIGFHKNREAMATPLWLEQNRRAISEKIQWLFDKPEGLLCDHQSSHHHILIFKEGTLIRMFFANPTRSEAVYQHSGCMAEFDLEEPLNLIIAYPQALLLSLLWRSDPKHVYTIGFAGGRIPMILHHYFPELMIENAEIDSDIVALAKQYFGVQLDHRNSVILQDGRGYLEKKSNDVLYDFIIIDAFRGTGYSPYHLHTLDFFQLCKKSLIEGGVVTINLVKDDHLFLEKINTLRSAFTHVYLHFDPIQPETYVFLGTDGEPLNQAERVARATQIQNQAGFAFPFTKRALDLKPLSKQDPYLSETFGVSTEILSSDAPLPKPLRHISPHDPIFFKADKNEPCPCGSPQKFKKCHGKGIPFF